MIFSVTERIEWLRCRRSWNYGSFNRRALSPIIGPLPLDTGTVWHRGHDQWYKNPKIPFKDWVLIEGAGRIASIKKSYKERIGVLPSDDELQNLVLSIDMLSNIAEMYQKYWGSSLPKGYRKLGSEVTAIVSVPGSEHQYEGTNDALLLDNKDMLWIGEFKTFDRHPNFEDLSKTEQFLDYLWILNRAIEEGQIEARGIGGLLYDGAWKRDTKPVDETFVRRKLTRKDDEIMRHTETIAICLNEMGADKYFGDHHPVYNRYYTCSSCKYDKLCATHMRGESTVQLERTKFVNREKAGFALTNQHGENFG